MKIKVMKLVTGEDVIADVENSGDNRFKLKNAVQLRMVPPQIAGSQPSMGFIPFPPFATKQSDSVLIEPLHVAYMYDPIEEILSNYQQTFSGIVTPSKQIITG
jgi:hypothetical protein